MDIGSFVGIISRTILDYSRDPYMSTVKGPVIRLLLTIAHIDPQEGAPNFGKPAADIPRTQRRCELQVPRRAISKVGLGCRVSGFRFQGFWV